MSSHHIFVSCRQCKTTEQVYTGDIELVHFDDADWELEFIQSLCRDCKESQGKPDLTGDCEQDCQTACAYPGQFSECRR